MTYDHTAALARHAAGMLSGEVYAIPKIIPQMFGGQNNFGGFDTPIPRYAIDTSDGWRYQFHTIADLHGWFRAHRRKK